MSYENFGYINNTCTYRIYLDGATYFAIPGNTGSGLPSYQNANPMTVLQAAWDALPDVIGGKIWLDGDLVIPGTLNVVGGGAGTSGQRKQIVRNSPGGLTTAQIQAIYLLSTAGVIKDLYFQGIRFNQIRFNADGGNPIRAITYDDCRLHTTTNANERGILVDSSEAVGDYIDNINFNGLKGVLANNTAGEGLLMTVRGGTSGVGNSLWTFGRGRYGVSRMTATVAGRWVHVVDGGYLDRVLFGEHTSFEPCDAGPQVLFYFEAQNTPFNGGGFTVADCTIETHQDTTLFQTIGGGGNSLATYIDFHGNIIGATTGTTITLANNLATLWMGAALSGRCGLEVHHNRFANLGGAFALGTLGEYDDFNVLIKDNDGLNPLGIVVNKFDNVSDLISATSGTAAVPTASTDYRVTVGDISIYTEDSADNNVALMLKDKNGVNLWGAAVSPNAMVGNVYRFDVKWGEIVNWGAFTGVMGAVDVGFE